MAIIGGAMRPDYSHSYHAVSELLEAGAPNKFLLDTLLSISDILAILFGIAILLLVLKSNAKRSTGIVGSLCLILIGVLGISTAIFFPMDPRHVQLAFPGLMHLIIVGIVSILSMLTPFIVAVWLKSQSGYARYATYSLVSAVLILVTGGYAAITVITESPLMGLAERITVGVYLQWTFFLSLKMYSSSK